MLALPLTTKFTVPRFPVFALPVTLNIPDAIKLAPDTLPDIDTTLPVIESIAVILPILALPATVNKPLVVILPPDTFPSTLKIPVLTKLPAATLPVIDNKLCTLL